MAIANDTQLWVGMTRSNDWYGSHGRYLVQATIARIDKSIVWINVTQPWDKESRCIPLDRDILETSDIHRYGWEDDGMTITAFVFTVGDN